MLNTIEITTQITPNIFIVTSTKETTKGTTSKAYKVDTKNNTCECEHYLSKPDNFVFAPCKHFQLCQKVMLESKLMNRVHQHLVTKKVKTVKVLKITPVKNSVKMYSVTYLLANGGKGCTFVNMKAIPEDKFFEASRAYNEPQKLNCTTNEKNTHIDKYAFGNQFDIYFTPKGWVRSVYTEFGKMQSLPSFSLYETCTSPMLPVNENNRNQYIEVLRTRPTSTDKKQVITMVYLFASPENPKYRFTNQREINNFRNYVNKYKEI